MIRLEAGTSRADILPQLGGGVAGLWSGDRPVLRPWSGRAADGPFALACNLLVPFSNRISGGGFAFAGQAHAILPNLATEPYPIHGDGFQRIWAVAAETADTARLTLADGEIGPFLYSAEVVYHLTALAFDARLSVTNRGATLLPFGLGLHPWFPRSPATRLQFCALGAWPERADHLPATRQPVPLTGGGPWHDPAPLPDGWLNTCYSGWTGEAWISQGPDAVSVHLGAEQLGTALVYSPSSAADFFCFEPVSHPVDAHNLPGQPGLVALASDQTLTASMSLTWRVST